MVLKRYIITFCITTISLFLIRDCSDAVFYILISVGLLFIGEYFKIAICSFVFKIYTWLRTVAHFIILPLNALRSIKVPMLSYVSGIGGFIMVSIGVIIELFIAVTSSELLQFSNLTLEIIIMISSVLIFQFIDNIIIQPYVYISLVKNYLLKVFIISLLIGSIARGTGILFIISTSAVIGIFAEDFFIRFRVVQKLT